MLSCGRNACGVLWCAIFGAGGMHCDFGECRAQADHLAHQALDGAHRAADRAAAEGGRVAGELARCVWLAGNLVHQRPFLLGTGDRGEEMIMKNAERLIARRCLSVLWRNPRPKKRLSKNDWNTSERTTQLLQSGVLACLGLLLRSIALFCLLSSSYPAIILASARETYVALSCVAYMILRAGSGQIQPRCVHRRRSRLEARPNDFDKNNQAERGEPPSITFSLPRPPIALLFLSLLDFARVMHSCDKCCLSAVARS